MKNIKHTIAGYSLPSETALKGRGYLFVTADGSPAANGREMQSLYNLAKTINPNKQAKSATNPLVLILAPGEYDFGINKFVADTSFIDILCLAGTARLNGINVTASNINLYNIITGLHTFNVADGLTGCTFIGCSGLRLDGYSHGYQMVTDKHLQTPEKTIFGAINKLYLTSNEHETNIRDMFVSKYDKFTPGTGPVDSNAVINLLKIGFSMKYANLESVDLQHRDNNGYDFRYANLSGSIMSQCAISSCNFDYSKITGGNFSYASINNSTFAHAVLSGVNFSSSIIEASDFSHANMSTAFFSGVQLYNVDFTGALFHSADINVSLNPASAILSQSANWVRWIDGVEYEIDWNNSIWIPTMTGSDYYY
ncbi:MAG TPA: pentapeptide repeat-containing protein [Paludibacter sp.]|nr:pentapeptide repeat-containing protein [Paludibacter sp.]